jgi:cell division septation protein DedD
MAAAQDVEISLGTGRLLGLFFCLVIVCGIFFGLGYTLGRNMNAARASAEAASPVPPSNSAKRKPASAGQPENSNPAADLTFFKTVEQKEAKPQLIPAAAPAQAAATAASTAPTDVPRSSAYVVQVSAVTKKEDAEALVEVLRKKNYPVFMASNAPSDSLYHVQVGPFSDLKEAEAMKARLAGDGYSPIVKK